MSDYTPSYRKKALDHYGATCTDCGHDGSSENPIEVHHIDRNPTNEEIENLQVLCHVCHCATHGRKAKPLSPRKPPTFTFVVFSASLRSDQLDWLKKETAKRNDWNVSQTLRDVIDQHTGWRYEEKAS